MKIRLLHILGEGIGGAERLVLDLTRSLDSQIYDISIMIIGRGGCVTDLIDRGRIRVIEFGCRNGYDICGLARIYRYLHYNKFDIVHNHQRAFFTNFAFLIQRHRPKLIYHEHGMTMLNRSKKDLLFYSVFGRFYDVFISLNDELTRYIKSANKGSYAKTVVIENHVDTNIFSPADSFKDKYHGPREKWTIGTVARMVPEKGLDLFIETARLVSRRRSDIYFIIVGDGPLRKKIELLAKDPELNGRLIVYGPTSRVEEVLKTFDLFLFTSKVESFGIVLLESLSCAIPILAASPEVGGAKDLLNILPGVFLTEQRSESALVEKIIALIEYPEKLIRAGQLGSAYVREKYELGNWIRSIDALYRGLISSSLPSP